MNNSRKFVLAGAGVAALLVILLVRGLLGGGTSSAKAAFVPPPIATSDVLVASSNVDSGTALNAGMVRWQQWPKSNVDGSFITQETSPNISAIVAGTVVRAPLVSGQPITTANIVHSDAAGVMAASLEDGTRGVSIRISAETGAGGFILPNDRVDVIVTEPIGERDFHARTILTNVRVLAVDQTYKQDKDQTVIGKTATLELTPKQAEQVERAQASGTISLSLRGLGDSAAATARIAAKSPQSDSSEVEILRYSVPRYAGAQKE